MSVIHRATDLLGWVLASYSRAGPRLFIGMLCSRLAMPLLPDDIGRPTRAILVWDIGSPSWEFAGSKSLPAEQHGLHILLVVVTLFVSC